ncbi:MAG TPA: hypothetical protein VHW66_21270 [Stellaceae bacterium]|jgi:hypothetical protein|nr:hypothetical protein [Stellaceae bacterium]
MAKSSRRPAAQAKKGKAFRPALLAGGLGLLWFVQYQQGGPADESGPAWAHGVVLGTRLLADIVGAWVVIAVAQLVFALIRQAFRQLRADTDREVL